MITNKATIQNGKVKIELFRYVNIKKELVVNYYQNLNLFKFLNNKKIGHGQSVKTLSPSFNFKRCKEELKQDEI